MPSSFDNLVVTWCDESDSYVTSANITPDVSRIPQFTETGSGEVTEAIFVLRALEGRYITSTSPKEIEQFDRIKIALDDKAGKSYARHYEIISIIPSITKGEGVLLTLKCLGIEYHAQNINMAFPFWFSNARDVGEKIGLFYQRNRGSTKQPLLNAFDADYNTTTKIGNALPEFTNNHYEYAMSEDTCYNRWMDVIDKLGASVANGGVLDFFELGFNSPAVQQIDLRIFSSGAGPEDDGGSVVTIKPDLTVGDTINPVEKEGDIENESGTVVVAYGDPTHGSLFTGFSIYTSGVFQFVFRPEWESTVSYLTEARVLYQGQHYKSLVDSNLNNTPPGPTAGSADVDANWSQIDMSDEFGDSVQYSEMTDGLIEEWIDCGCDSGSHTGPTAGVYTGTGAAFMDSNMVVDNDGFFRTWVHSKAKTTADFSALSNTGQDWALVTNSSTTLPRGFRILVDGVGTGLFGGTDRQGNIYDFNIVEVDGPTASGGVRLDVKYVIDSTDANFDGMQVLVIDEGKIYEWDDTTNAWIDKTATDLVNDCVHPWSTMQQQASFDFAPAYTANDRPDITKDGSPFSTNIDSAIEIVYDFNIAFTDRVTDQAEYFRHGAWVTWQVPFPPNDITNSSKCGKIYGGRDNTTDNPREPATLDTTNFGYTPTGLLGFNQTDTEQLGALSGIGLFLSLLLEARLPTSASLVTVDGVGKFRAWMIDVNDNTVIQDFEITSTDAQWYRVNLPFSAFKNYKAHKPRFVVKDSVQTTNPKRNDMNKNIFEFRNIKFIGIQMQDSYDEFGRFAPEFNTLDFDNTGLTAAFGGKATLKIDGFHFDKVLLVTSGQDTTRDLEVDFLQRPHIMVYDQLKQDVRAQLEIEKFRHKEYDIETTGDNIFDIDFGDSFYLLDSNIVSDADNSTSNNIKLVAKRIEYSITKTPGGPGGLRRRIRGVKRFT